MKKQKVEANEKGCKWVLEYDSSWDSQCGVTFLFNHKGPIYNGFKYCPYCGNKMNQNEKE